MLLPLVLLLLSACECEVYQGYGRYTLKVNCERVIIEGSEYLLSIYDNGELVIDNHTLERGIYRKTKPWLYIHNIDAENNQVDVTFDSGLKSEYPLYTGSYGTMNISYTETVELNESNNIQIENYWLVSHVFTNDGIYFDLHENLDPLSNLDWKLVQGNILVNSNGSPKDVSQVNTSIQILDFDLPNKKAKVKFTQM